MVNTESNPLESVNSSSKNVLKSKKTISEMGDTSDIENKLRERAIPDKVMCIQIDLQRNLTVFDYKILYAIRK